ncbi:unnamed protein product [Lathyrus oleraceus]
MDNDFKWMTLKYAPLIRALPDLYPPWPFSTSLTIFFIIGNIIFQFRTLRQWKCRFPCEFAYEPKLEHLLGFLRPSNQWVLQRPPGNNAFSRDLRCEGRLFRNFFRIAIVSKRIFFGCSSFA